MEISSERIDDIPLIAALLKQMEVAKWIDQQLKQPHGNHQGLSYGQLSVLLLIYIISQSDHRLCAAETWVNTHRITLELVTGWSIGEKDVTDDRLARVVEQFGLQGEACQEIEQKLGKHLIRAYELPTEVGRLDTTSFTVHHEQIESDADSLLRYGHSKDKRPDLLQYRQMLGTLDPTGIPLVSETLPGNGADDPLYWPAWQRMAKVIGHKLFVFLADCKASAIATRANIANEGGIYCFPLPLTGQNPALLKQWVLDPPSASVDIRLPRQEDDEPAVGKGFEVELGKLPPKSSLTNAPITRLSLNQAIAYYRDQWVVERGFHRFKRGQLPALPIYFQNQDRIEGLMFLLTLALRVFTSIEFVVREAISASKQKLAGLYDGNPKRATERPSAEQLLKAFDNLTLYLLPDTSIFVTTLSALHRQILSLLRLPDSIYSLHIKPRKT
jgi:transposase